MGAIICNYFFYIIELSFLKMESLLLGITSITYWIKYSIKCQQQNQIDNQKCVHT